MNALLLLMFGLYCLEGFSKQMPRMGAFETALTPATYQEQRIVNAVSQYVFYVIYR